VGEGTRLAAATGAWICFEDEAGQNLRPPKARTWARRGRTPVVTVPGKGPGRVSVAGLVCLKPGARGHLFYRIRIHRGRKGERRSLSEADYADLIAAAHNQLHAPVIADRPLIWGSGTWCAHPGRSRASKDGGDLDLAAKSRPFAEISENSCGTGEGMGSIRGSTPRFRQRYGNRAVVERAVGTFQLGGDPDDSVRGESACSQA